MMQFIDQTLFIKSMQHEIEAQLNDAFEPIIEKAKADLEAQLRKKLGGIALSLAKEYTVSRREESLIIEVRNQA